jgi:drug efflux transport system permease protein
MRRRILVLVRKELLQALREPRMRILLIAPPLVQMVVFGFAVNLDVENAAIAWMDQDRTSWSRRAEAAFEGSTRFTIVGRLATEAEIAEVLDRGDAVAVIRILPGFGGQMERGGRPDIQVLIDGTDSNTAALVASYARRILDRLGAEARGRSVAATGPARLGTEARVWFNPELRSRNYFVPGVVVNIVALVTVMLTALSIVREKEIGTMEQLMVTPIRPLELMLGKTIPFAAIGMLQLALLTALAQVVFRVPFRGSYLLLAGSAAVFLLTTLGAGLFISTISGTQQQAMMTFFLMFFPMFLLSGFTFPIHSMPVPIQYVTWLNPVRYFMEIVRGLFLKGVGLGVLWPQIALLALIGVSILSFSTLRFRKHLD